MTTFLRCFRSNAVGPMPPDLRGLTLEERLDFWGYYVPDTNNYYVPDSFKENLREHQDPNRRWPVGTDFNNSEQDHALSPRTWTENERDTSGEHDVSGDQDQTEKIEKSWRTFTNFFRELFRMRRKRKIAPAPAELCYPSTSSAAQSSS